MDLSNITQSKLNAIARRLNERPRETLGFETPVGLVYEDDETHPIPFVGNLDAVLTSSAGVRLGIVIASPLKSDDTSQQRLVRKLENYVREFTVRREQWVAEKREPMQAWLYIYVHPESDAQIFQLIQDHQRWIESNSSLW